MMGEVPGGTTQEVVIEDVTTTPSGKGGTPDGDIVTNVVNKAPETDALDKLQASYNELTTKFNKMVKADEKRTQTELEEQGKHKELIANLKTKNAELEADGQAKSRKADMYLAVMSAETTYDKALLMKHVERLDVTTGGEKDFDYLIKTIEAEFGQAGGGEAPTETEAFGGGGTPPSGKNIQSEKIKELERLGVAAFRSGRAAEQNLYSEYRAKLTQEQIAIPHDMAKRIDWYYHRKG